MTDLLDRLLDDIGLGDGSNAGTDGGTKSVAVTVDGVTYDVAESKDSLGRNEYAFVFGDAGDDAQSFGFAYQGTIATLRVPKDTETDAVRAMLGQLAMHKSAEPEKKRKDVFDDALKDALESAGGNALYGGWWAFCSFIMDDWTGELEDIDQATYDTLVDKFSNYLKSVWAQFAAMDIGSVAGIQQDAANAIEVMKKGAKPVEKAGARLSRATRDELEAARTAIDGVLADKKDDGDGTDSGDADAGDNSEVEGLKEVLAELKRVKATNADLAKRVAAISSEPIPDPLNAGSPGGKKEKMTSGNSTYDMVNTPPDYYGV